jgi:heterodisulfide reductase subunit B
MDLAVYWGCRILTSQYAYELSVREVLSKFDLKLIELSETNCCGDPVKSINDSTANYLSARILALTNTSNINNLLVPCNRCHFTISETKSNLDENENLNQKITNLLKEENLSYDDKIKLWHIIDFLHDYVGLDRIKKMVKRPLKGLKLATHPGCQIIRYSELNRPDQPENPQKLDNLIRVLGAETIDYAEKLDCCGASLLNSHVDSALSLTGTKLKTLQEDLGVDGLVVSCPDCGLMFDFKQKDAGSTVGAKLNLPVIYYTQLLGLALDATIDALGLKLNQSPIDDLLAKI